MGADATIMLDEVDEAHHNTILSVEAGNNGQLGLTLSLARGLTRAKSKVTYSRSTEEPTPAKASSAFIVSTRSEEQDPTKGSGPWRE